jgi:hypothetical protein
LVIFRPTAALDRDCANDAKRLGDGAVARGQCSVVQGRLFLGWPGNALWSKWIEQMDMGIDNRDRRRGCRAKLIRNNQTSGQSKKCSSIHDHRL